MISDFLLNHLWQSTLFAAAAALLTFLFRKNHARVRYALWLAASIKFLIPFSLFIAIGNSIDFDRQLSPAAVQPAITFVQEISLPFDLSGSAAVVPSNAGMDQSNLIWLAYAAWICGCLAILAIYLARGRRFKGTVRNAAPITHGRTFEAVQRIGGRPLRVRLASSTSSTEPGVFGIIRPVLLLPEGMADRLSDAELEAIIAHELAHVRRRDNLAAAIHMFVEALFWFHPMVWWIGSKLIQERECACDEEVLRLGKDPQVYAEGILKVCEFYLESPLDCIAGVTGANMKKRIHTIMTRHIGRKLSLVKKMVLGTAALAGLAVPVSIGFLDALSSQAQPQTGPKPTFEVVSIKETPDCGNVAQGVILKIPGSITYEPGGRYTACSQLSYIIRDAYQLELFASLTGVPDWSTDTLYKIEAKADGNPDKEQMRLMVQSLLEERFKLKIHRETREAHVYSLVIAKNGHKLQPANDEQGNLLESLSPSEESKKKRMQKMSAAKSTSEIIAALTPGSYMIMGKPTGGQQFTGKAISMDKFAIALYGMAGLKVIDKTALAGLYDIQVIFARPGPPSTADPVSSVGLSDPTIFNALQEQLGLKLESGKAPLDNYVIDSVEKPSEN